MLKNSAFFSNTRSKKNVLLTITYWLIAGLMGLNYITAFADGNETLGPPSIAIAPGTGMVAAGTGLFAQPSNLNISVPGGATISQVLVYWQGDGIEDNTITIDGTEVTGVKIGHNFRNTSAFRADITAMGFVTNGANTLVIGGLNYSNLNHGAGILVIIDDSSGNTIELRDGHDEAYINAGRTMVPQSFSFAQSTSDRTIDLSMFFAEVIPGRPNAIDVTVSGPIPFIPITTTYDNLMNSNDGDQWDTILLPVNAPAGADTITVEPMSVDNLGIGVTPASMAWNMIGILIPPPDAYCGDGIVQPPEECDDGNLVDGDGCSSICTLEPEVTGRFTGGGHQIRVDGVRITRGLTIHCDLLLSNNLEVNWNGNKFHMLEHLVTVECSDDPLIDQFPPDAPLDTLIGVGTGRYNGQDGFTIEFTLVDAGEPGREDMASLLIYETSNPGNIVLDVPLQLLDGGNLQAHEDQPHKGANLVVGGLTAESNSGGGGSIGIMFLGCLLISLFSRIVVDSKQVNT